MVSQNKNKTVQNFVFWFCSNKNGFGESPSIKIKLNAFRSFWLGLCGCERFYFCRVWLWGQIPFLGQVQKAAKFCLSKNSLAFPFWNIKVCFPYFSGKTIQICGKTVKEKWKLPFSSLAATSTGNRVFKPRSLELAVTFENTAKTTTRSLQLNWFPFFVCLGKSLVKPL